MFKKKSLVIVFLATALLVGWINFASGETEHFEKGDLLFRKGFVNKGHTGIYCLWYQNMDPDARASHMIIEAAGRGLTVWQTTYESLYNTAEFKGGGSLYPTAEEREDIIKRAKNRIGYPYDFYKGYKDRMPWGKTYRCDGLAEHVYEITLGGYGIVNDTNFRNLWPYKQMESMGISAGIPPKISSIVITPSTKDDQGKYHIKGTVTIKCPEVSDGPRGSGIRRVEFWLSLDNYLDNNDKKIGVDDHPVLIKDTYKISFDTTTVPSGEYNIIAKAFDQAGNYATASIPVVIGGTSQKMIMLQITGSYPYSYSIGEVNVSSGAYSTITSAVGTITAIYTDGTYIYYVANSGGSYYLYKYDFNGVLITSFLLSAHPLNPVYGIAVIGSNIYFYYDGLIDKYTSAGVFVTSSVYLYTTRTNHDSGMCSDGTNFYVAGNKIVSGASRGVIYILDTDLNLTSTINYPTSGINSIVYSITTDNVNLYIFAYHNFGGGVWGEYVEKWSLAGVYISHIQISSNWPPTGYSYVNQGIATDGTTIYLSNTTTNTVNSWSYTDAHNIFINNP